mmetsp:Transcript_41109/g.66117  ORF Transcript_41109/g.66117 Transcript_41109/m.66117 type:complete len:218 (+) Transcript_41109:613-1266(+)
MQTIEEVKPTSQILLVMIGTKTDMVSGRAVTEKEARGVAKEFKALYFEVTAKEDGDQCKEIFQTIARRLSPSGTHGNNDDDDEKGGGGLGDIDLMKELDELDSDYYGDEEDEDQSFCCKLCCCLGIFCPCLAFLCDKNKSSSSRAQKSSHIMLQGADTPNGRTRNSAGNSNHANEAGHQGDDDSPSNPFASLTEQGVFTIDPEEELEDLDIDDDDDD